MIQPKELRIGNAVLYKRNNRITMVPCSYEHFEHFAKGEGGLLFPVVLKAEILERCGFAENKEYPLYPQAREFRLVTPVKGKGDNGIVAYVKSNGECFAQAVLGGQATSNPVQQLHQLQNLYFALTGEELTL